MDRSKQWYEFRTWVDFYMYCLIWIFKTSQLKRIMFKIECWMINPIFNSSINTWNENIFVIQIYPNYWIAIIDHIEIEFLHYTFNIKQWTLNMNFIDMKHPFQFAFVDNPQYIPTILNRWLDILLGYNATSILQFEIRYHLLTYQYGILSKCE